MVDVMGNAGALGDDADMHVTVEDVPAFLVGVFARRRVRGPCPIKARPAAIGKLSIPWGSGGASL
jgi:hypothetical protein